MISKQDLLMKWTWLKVIQDLYCWSPSIWIKALRANWHRWKFNLVNGFGQSFHNCSCWCCFPICNTINWRKIIYYSQENLSLVRRKTLKLISVAQISNGSQKFELLLWAWALSSVLCLDSLGCRHKTDDTVSKVCRYNKNTGQDWVRLDKIGKDLKRLDRTGQEWRGIDRNGLGRTGQDLIGLEKTGLGKNGQGKIIWTSNVQSYCHMKPPFR